MVLPLMQQIRQNHLCPAQEVFTMCIRSWLESLETSIPDVSSVHESQCEFILKAIADQELICWHLAMRGYLSVNWRLVVSANPYLMNENCKTVMLLWSFTHKM
jgi:hypothetical protein